MMSSKENLMSMVEEAYRRAVDAMTPAEKFARMHALNYWGRWNIARIVTEKQGPLPPEELKWQIALEIYGQNAICRKLIEEQLARVRNR